MRLDGRRLSGNVEDRRGMNFPGGRTSLGIGGLIVVGLITWLTGGNPLSVLSGLGGGGLGSGISSGAYSLTEADRQAATFAEQILASTEDVWTAQFQRYGRVYTPPKMVLFTGATASGCGNASSSTGPFYCPADKTVYIDLSFFDEMRGQLGAGGDFAYAYVIAHEVGHHVQDLLGTMDEVNRAQARASQAESNQLSVRLELQADFYAGVWAYYENQQFGSLEPGDIEEGLNAAAQIGDDRLQMASQGYTVPDSFNHGTSAQRQRWLRKGIESGDMAAGDTFSIPYSQL